jgi:hypothetical protein
MFYIILGPMRHDADTYLRLNNFACWSGNEPEWLTMQKKMITGIPYGNEYVVFEGLKHSIAKR